MAIASSGAVSFADLRTEYVGGSGAISLSDLYRGGSNIRAKSGDNQGTNLAASVPASGTINFANFHGTAKGFKFTFTSTHGNQNFSSLFGDDWDLNYPKIVDINSGVSIYGSGTDAITIPSGLAGGLTINNAGTIYGFGGAANGGAGGNCINNAASGVTINNTANIFAGGGGGGAGGTGGNGTVSTSTTLGPYGQFNPNYLWSAFGSQDSIVWNGTFVGTSSGTSYSSGGYTYTKGSVWYYGENSWYYRLSRTGTTTSNTTGGSGGAGGVGQGYNVTNASGAAGASGGTNAGTGGAGGAGATYGQAGATGSTGANGNSTNGSAGSSGGAAGAAVTGTSVTMNNTGTIHGAVA